MNQAQRFLLEHLYSYEDLLLLLWLHRHSEDEHTPHSVAARTNMSEDAALAALERLEAHGFTARRGPRFRYECSGDHIEVEVALLARSYENDQSGVVDVMTHNAMERMQAAMNRRLADVLGLPRDQHAP